ncbi:sulfite exporter TauE/SafE family protein [Jannaschia ovalis]|uniref:Probable membrane transporter protein n=1 Tax=Jannaschia ovalis TaxID=3038773 RepID=A0ABY8LD12_9RHOB|nr:sulfite exporter TauE/SafE family protein [Jannaschia sp. GRR-S6-38]WGH79204.1 sulfite exporter TauE/SafE family protein [Jannaschia sp. GRR-S6-38]
METLTPFLWTAAVAIAFGAGLIKGSIGFALPLVMVSGLSTFLDPRLALAGLILPVLMTNGMQILRAGAGPAIAATRLHWRYVLMVVLAILIAAQAVTAIPRQVFYFVLGIPVVLLSVVQLAGWVLTIPPARRIAAEWGVGAVSGVLGGLVGTWGPTTVLYLMAIETPKDRQMVVQGVIYGIGSVALLVAHLASGLLNERTVWFSAAMLVPAVIGMALGQQISDRMDQARFRKLTLVVLVIAGFNLIRKGVAGI